MSVEDYAAAAMNIARGLELSSTTSRTANEHEQVLDNLELCFDQYNDFDLEDLVTIVRSLQGHQHIKKFCLNLGLDQIPILHSLAMNVLGDKGCKIERLRIDCVEYGNGQDPPTRHAVQSIWDILKTGNDSVREVGILLPNGVNPFPSPDDISVALKLALSPDNQVEVFEFRSELKCGLHVEDLGQVLEDCDRGNNVPDIEIHADAFATFCHQSKVRTFEILKPMQFFEGEFGAKNTHSLLYQIAPS
jgi:hypothetical protein